MISTEILQNHHAFRKQFPKGSTLFSVGQKASYYFQVEVGEVKIINYNGDGKEFIQGIFTEGDSFGESPLFTGHTYLTNAIASVDSVLWVMTKADFMRMLDEVHQATLAVCKRLSDRLYYKSLMAMEISSEDAEHRLLRFFDYLKVHVGHLTDKQKYHINLTRQELADLTGLRVETVIRAVKLLEKKGEVTIVDRKIYR